MRTLGTLLVLMAIFMALISQQFASTARIIAIATAIVAVITAVILFVGATTSRYGRGAPPDSPALRLKVAAMIAIGPLAAIVAGIVGGIQLGALVGIISTIGIAILLLAWFGTRTRNT